MATLFLQRALFLHRFCNLRRVRLREVQPLDDDGDDEGAGTCCHFRSDKMRPSHHGCGILGFRLPLSVMSREPPLEWRSGGRCQFRDSGFNHISGLNHIFGIRDSGFRPRITCSAFVIRDSFSGFSSSGFGIRDSGFGIRDSNHIFGIRGFGIRHSNHIFGNRDSGCAIRDWDGPILRFGIQDSGFGIRNSTHIFGIRDSGFGTRLIFSGFGIRDSGFGIRDWNGPILRFGIRIRDSGFARESHSRPASPDHVSSFE